MALYREPARQPTSQDRCSSSTGTPRELREAAYIIPEMCEQREVMRSRVWRAGASETPHPQHARTLKQTSHLQQLPARCRRDRDPGAPQRSCPDRIYMKVEAAQRLAHPQAPSLPARLRSDYNHAFYLECGELPPCGGRE